ncbi:Hypothetical predicted protein [Octopus vulgaris]|uniref:Uncharacterized protein n=1 Tax=Octopus vulgaris TaxID=6645 RepID=A0AA36B484_OCTVU|nr:Hypothetical predicted protein [Octopus vulgaris]
MINLCAIAYELSNNLVTAKSYTFQIAPAAMSATFCVCRLYSGIKINDSKLNYRVKKENTFPLKATSLQYEEVIVRTYRHYTVRAAEKLAH